MTRVRLLFAFALLSVIIPLFNFQGAQADSTQAIRLDPDAPALPPNPTPIDILGFAAASLRWALEDHPNDGGKKNLSPTEWQLVEALHYLDKVPDTPDDVAAKEQSKQRQQAAWKAIVNALKDPSLKKMKEDIWKTVLQPTIAGDGQGPTRDVLKAQVLTALYNYRVNGQPKVDPLESLIDSASKTGPQWQGVGPSERPNFEKEFQDAEATRQAIKIERDRISAERRVLIDNTARINPSAREAHLRFQQAWAARRRAEENAPGASISFDGKSFSFTGFDTGGGTGHGQGAGNGNGQSLFTFLFGD
jgi:hypothetical protein